MRSPLRMTVFESSRRTAGTSPASTTYPLGASVRRLRRFEVHAGSDSTARAPIGRRQGVGDVSGPGGATSSRTLVSAGISTASNTMGGSVRISTR